MATCEEPVAKKFKKFVKVKRKATDDKNSQLLFGENAKRFKFIGSTISGDEEHIKELIVEKTEEKAVEQFVISDLADFIDKYKSKIRQFPKSNEGK